FFINPWVGPQFIQRDKHHKSLGDRPHLFLLCEATARSIFLFRSLDNRHREHCCLLLCTDRPTPRARKCQSPIPRATAGTPPPWSLAPQVGCPAPRVSITPL